MSIDFLTVNVGNTRVQIGSFLGHKLQATVSVACDRPTDLGDALAEARAPLQDAESTCAVVGSVNAAVAGHVIELLGDKLKLPVYEVEKDMPIPIGRQLDREAIVGDDRLLNAAAAFDVLKQGCVVVDAGSAVTIDYVDGTGTFHGGVIAPGGQMMLDALHASTAQLPQVTLERPTEAIGHNTVEAMRSAVYHGIRGMVRELVERYAEHAGAYPLVIATGGDAELLLDDFDLIDRIVPELTLMGLAATLRVAMEESD